MNRIPLVCLSVESIKLSPLSCQMAAKVIDPADGVDLMMKIDGYSHDFWQNTQVAHYSVR